MVYLDLTHQSEKFLEDRLSGILDIYTKFTGDDPKKVPMKIFRPCIIPWAASGPITKTTVTV